jgi:hypothetical protein
MYDFNFVKINVPIVYNRVEIPLNIVSKYNKEYFCEINGVTIENGYHFMVQVNFHVHGDNSLGKLQDPRSSRLFLDKHIAKMSAHHFEIEDLQKECKGSLTYYALAKHDKPDYIMFVYGAGGYERVMLLEFNEEMVNTWHLHNILKPGQYCYT